MMINNTANCSLQSDEVQYQTIPSVTLLLLFIYFSLNKVYFNHVMDIYI